MCLDGWTFVSSVVAVAVAAVVDDGKMQLVKGNVR